MSRTATAPPPGIAGWVSALQRCTAALADEAGRLDEAMATADESVEARHDALGRFARVVRNAQRILEHAERARGVLPSPDRELDRAYWVLRRSVADSIGTGAAWRRHLTASDAALAHERRRDAAHR